MPGSKKDKQYANTRARRHSIVTVSHGHSKKSKKDDDTESVSSTADTVVPPPPPKPQCPLRPYMEVMFEKQDGEENSSICPLRKVKLSHVLPLCFFLMFNMLLVVCTLMVTGLYRLTARGNKQTKSANLGLAGSIVALVVVGLWILVWFHYSLWHLILPLCPGLVGGGLAGFYAYDLSVSSSTSSSKSEKEADSTETTISVVNTIATTKTET